MANCQLVVRVSVLAGQVSVQAPMTGLQKERKEACLESRIEKLQSQIASVRGRKSSLVMMDDFVPVPKESAVPEFTPEQKPMATSRATQRKEMAEMDDLVSNFGFLAVDATTRDFHGFTSFMSFSRLVLSSSVSLEIPSSRARLLPPRHAAMPLIQHYLDKIFVLLPVFTETALFASIDAVYQNNGHNASDLDHWFVNMVLAVASASLSRSQDDQQYENAVGFTATALKRAEAVIRPGSISGIQALVLLAEYAMLDPHHFDSWYLIGVASRVMIDSGLHQDPPKQSQVSKAKLELRRKVFYCVYSLDRSISMVHVRAFSFSDDSANVLLPSAPGATSLPIESWEKQLWRQPLDTALHLFQIRRIQSAWYQEIFQSGRAPFAKPDQYIWGVFKEMREWSRSVPDSVSADTKEYFEIELLYNYIYALTPSGKVHKISEIGKTLVFEHSISYASKIEAVTSNPQNREFYTFHDGLRVYFVGQQFLDVFWQNQDQLLHGHTPDVGTALPPGHIAPPPVGKSGGLRDNISRTIKCINQINNTLGSLGRRWSTLLLLQERFRTESAYILESLYLKQSNESQVPETPGLKLGLNESWSGASRQ
ncbi:MAG: hypothetical protein M1829_004056 [Trizodia sp. TS-e1964]|nr:MAG: hypothetical protein M1829_004056 [Trizodia sp. TS-e1964]